MTTSTYPTRRPRKSDGPIIVDSSWYGERDGQRLCELDIRCEPEWMADIPDRADPPDGPAICANVADIAWVSPMGSVMWTCSGHVPHPDDEQLRPQQDGQWTGWWAVVSFEPHSLAGLHPVPLKGCSKEVFERATAVAARLAEYGVPPEIELPYGWMGSEEDEARLEAAGEQTCFPFIPESLGDEFGGATSMFDVASKIREPAD